MVPILATPLTAPIDTTGWSSAMLVVRAPSVSRTVRVVVVPVRIESDGTVERDGVEVGAIIVEGQGERLFTSALAAPPPRLVGVYAEAAHLDLDSGAKALGGSVTLTSGLRGRESS